MSAAPAMLGFPPSPPPPAEWLPPAAARMQRIVSLVLRLMFEVPAAQRGTTHLKGFAVSPGVYEGPVRVIRSVDELPTVQQGDVLVAPSTGPTFNVVLPLIGALVTERGGALSHAAIVSREYGLPGIVGCVGATRALATGMRVRVDGDKGEVWTITP
jgi:pyruvate,water dikinase